MLDVRTSNGQERARIYNLLSWPWIYRLSQRILAPGAVKRITEELSRRLAKLPPAERILDVGCGPASLLWTVNQQPIGLDFSLTYVKEYRRHGGEAFVGSADRLPFADASFDGVFTIGLLHHLSDEQAAKCITEMLRVCRPGGYVLVVDAVLPEPYWRRPLAWAIRMLDRGSFMRHECELAALLPSPNNWEKCRATYSLTGLESLTCTLAKE